MVADQVFDWPGNRLERFARNQTGRDFAVGDIHGCFVALDAALKQIGFDTTRDRLFSIGDLVDRGPQSSQVLEWLDRPWFHAICGNHDFMTWRAALGQPYPHVDHRQHGGSWLYELPAGLQRLIGERLAALPVAIELETATGPVALVHADCPYDDWHAVSSQSSFSESDLECFMWSPQRFKSGYDHVVRNVRALVHGHMTTPMVRVLGNAHFIDTGGWRSRGGHFTFLDLETLKPQHARGVSAVLLAS